MNTIWYWLIAAIILLIIELIKTNGYTLWISVSAAIVALIMWLAPHTKVLIQYTVFIVLGLSMCAWWYRSLKSKPIQINKLRAKAYFGRVYTLEKAVKKGKGQLEIDGLIWFIDSKKDFAKGDKIRIKGANGVVLLVEAYEK